MGRDDDEILGIILNGLPEEYSQVKLLAESQNDFDPDRRDGHDAQHVWQPRRSKRAFARRKGPFSCHDSNSLDQVLQLLQEKRTHGG